MRYVLFYLLVFTHLYGFSQKIKMENYTYKSNIKSVQILINGIISSVPVMKLNHDQMTIIFDDLGDQEENDLFYRIILCDRDWNKSQIDPIEYIDGFHEERIRDWQTSIGTKVDFTHYWLSIPNRDTRIKVSGNYILYVYNNMDDEEPLFTRRFIVSENLTGVDLQWVRPSQTDLIRFGQQMNTELFVKNINLRNPQRDVTTTVIRNGDWSSAMHNIEARNYNNGVFSFDKFGRISFLGLNEYRSFDTRNLLGRGFGVKEIDKSQDITEVILTPTQRRDQNVYIFTFDFNGNFYIDNRDDFDRALFSEGSNIQEKNKLVSFRNNFSYYDNISDVWQIKDKEIRADYVNVIFTLKSSKLPNDVYIYGAFTDFQLKPEFKMKYDEVREMYIGEAILKQGYYNYYYAMKNKDNTPEFKYTEGTWQDTENEYKMIVYYREFGSRYDRVIGVHTSNTADFSF